MEDMVLEQVEILGDEKDEIDERNFHEIAECKKGKIAFLDGGNAAIIDTPSFRLELVRLCYLLYDGIKKTETGIREFYLIVKAGNEGGRMVYNTKCFPISFRINELKFDANDKKLSAEGERVEIGMIANAARRIAELELMKEAIDKVGANGLVIVDGDLEAKKPYEEGIMRQILEKAKMLNVGVGALSKTSTMLSRNGNSLLGIAAVKEGEWHYPAGAGRFVVKLNRKSNYVFRLDYFGGRFEEALGLLKEHSRDISILGYPYGLYEADKFGRVSNAEKEHLAMKFLFRMRNQKNIKGMANAINFHRVLDTIRYSK